MPFKNYISSEVVIIISYMVLVVIAFYLIILILFKLNFPYSSFIALYAYLFKMLYVFKAYN